MGDEIQPAQVKREVGQHEIAAWILMAAGLLMVLKLHLLSALLAGLLVYELVHVAMLRLQRRLSSERAGMAVTALAILVIGIVGAQINARAWELLAAMLLMEAAFGIAGVVAAPIYYAYMKDELTAQEWV